jgi:general secretion pathway protein L
MTLTWEHVIEIASDGDLIRGWVKSSDSERIDWKPYQQPDELNTVLPRRCRVIVPGTSVLITQVQTPAKARGEQRKKAIAYALEEQLAADIETLHFAGLDSLARPQATGVAVAARDDMDRWLEAVRSLGFEPVSFIPDTALVTEPESGARLHVDSNRCWLVEANGDALAFEPDLVETYLETVSAETLEITHEPSLDIAHIQSVAQNQGLSVMQTREVSRFDQKNTVTAWELLTGDYALAQDWTPIAKKLRWPLILAAVFAVTDLATLAFETRVLRTEINALEARVERRFQQILPNTEMIAPKRQLEAYLQRRGQMIGNSPIPSINALAGVIDTAGDVEIVGLEYSVGVLEAKLQAASLQSLNALTSALAAPQRRVELQQASTTSEGTVGELRIEDARR